MPPPTLPASTTAAKPESPRAHNWGRATSLGSILWRVALPLAILELGTISCGCVCNAYQRHKQTFSVGRAWLMPLQKSCLWRSPHQTGRQRTDAASVASDRLSAKKQVPPQDVGVHQLCECVAGRWVQEIHGLFGYFRSSLRRNSCCSNNTSSNTGRADSRERARCCAGCSGEPSRASKRRWQTSHCTSSIL